MAGINLGGGYATFPGVVGTAITKVCALEVGRTGLTEREAAEEGFEAVAASIDATTHRRLPARRQTDDGEAGGGAGHRAPARARRSSGRTARPSGSTRWPPPSTPGMRVDELIDLDLAYAPPFATTWDPIHIAARRLADRPCSGACQTGAWLWRRHGRPSKAIARLVGRALCRAYSDLVDGWLAELVAAAEAECGTGGVALVAVGGYGRAELSLQSDIDVVLLHAGRSDIGALADRRLVPDLGRGREARPRGAHHAGRRSRWRPTTSTPPPRSSRCATSPATRTSPTTSPGGRSSSGRSAPSAGSRSCRGGSRDAPRRGGRGGVPARARPQGGPRRPARRPRPPLGRGGPQPPVGGRRPRARGGLRRAAVGPGRAAPSHRPTRRPPAARGAGRRGRRPRRRVGRRAHAPPGRRRPHDRLAQRRRVAADRRVAQRTARDGGRAGTRPIGAGLALRDGEVHLTADADPAADPSLVLRAAAAAAAGDTRIHRVVARPAGASGPRPSPSPWPTEVRRGPRRPPPGRAPRHPGRRGARPDGPVGRTCCPSGRPCAASRSATPTTASPSTGT